MGEQHDAAEVLLLVLNELENNLVMTPPLIAVQRKCLGCNEVSIFYSDLLLSVMDNPITY